MQRFAELFAKLALDADPAAFKVVYEDWISRGYYVFAQSNEVLCTLKKRGFALYCVTNGLKNTQFKRLKGADLLQYFEIVFISEEAGYPKPQKEYFDYVFAHLRETDRSRILLVGDSLQTDIAGGARAGLDTVWYNPRGLAAEEELQPTYVIRELKELLTLVGPGPRARRPENEAEEGEAEENGSKQIGKSIVKQTAK